MSCNPKYQGQKQKMTPGKTFQEAKSKKILGKKKRNGTLNIVVKNIW